MKFILSGQNLIQHKLYLIRQILPLQISYFIITVMKIKDTVLNKISSVIKILDTTQSHLHFLNS